MNGGTFSVLTIFSRAKYWFFFFTLITLNESLGQSNTVSFSSILLPGNAALSGLGTVNASRVDYNVNFFQSNPALNSDSLDGWASANHLFYFAGIGLSSFAYQHHFNSVGSLNFGLNHLSLGTISGYDIYGNPTTDFTSGETSIVIGKSHQVSFFRFGLNIRGAFSNIAGFRATALLFDLGGVFVHPTKDFSVGLVLKNLGVVLNEFSGTSSSRLPFDVQAGVSYKPEHMPIRFSATVYNLTDYHIPYQVSNLANEKTSTLDKVFSHLTFGAELVIHKNVDLLLGYNFQRHQELKLEGSGGGSGISIGALIKLRHLDFSFSRSGYVTGGAYQLSLNMNTNKILRRNKI